MQRLSAAALVGSVLVVCRAAAQQPVPLDGPQRPLQDTLFERLIGTWRMSGSVGSRQVSYAARGDWVLNHQFLRLVMRDSAQVPTYEAHVYIGRDNLSERYVAHWLDVFGGRWSETLGYGTRTGDSVEFVFEYPDGPFRTRFSLDPGAGWTVLMRQRSAGGDWRVFGRFLLRPS